MVSRTIERPKSENCSTFEVMPWKYRLNSAQQFRSPVNYQPKPFGIAALLALILLLGLMQLSFPFSTALMIPTATSGSPSLFAEVSGQAEAITTDKDGNVYASLFLDRTIVKITPDGTVSEIATIAVPEPPLGFFAAILGLVVTDTGDILVGDTACQCIMKVTQDGEVSAYSSSGITLPNGLVLHDEFLYVTDTIPGAIFRIPDGGGEPELVTDHDLLTAHSEGAFGGANGLVFDQLGNLFVTNVGDDNIIKITMEDGVAINVEIFGEPGAFRGADGITIDDAGNLIIAENRVNTISALTPDGERIVIMTSLDSDGSTGLFEAPTDVAFHEMKIYVSNADFAGGVNSATEAPFTISLLEVNIPGSLLNKMDQLEGKFESVSILHSQWVNRPHIFMYEFSTPTGNIDYYRVQFLDGPGGSPNGSTFVSVLIK